MTVAFSLGVSTIKFSMSSGNRITVATYFTILRIVLSPFILLLAWLDLFTLAFGVLCVAALSDALDGFIARQFNQRSQLGSQLDPVGDKVLSIFGFLGLILGHNLVLRPPLWFVIPLFARELVILSGATLFNFLVQSLYVRATLCSKLATIVQFSLLFYLYVFNFTALYGWHLFSLSGILTGLYVITLALSYYSAGEYIIQGLKLLGLGNGKLRG